MVKPLQERPEPVYVVPGSDAESIASRRFKNKTVKQVAGGLRVRSVSGSITYMPHTFQPNQSRGLDATFQFTFTGDEPREVTVRIRNRTIEVEDGLIGRPDVHVTADAKTWLGFLAKEKSLIRAILTRKIRLKGNPKLLLAFGKCFPSAGPRRKHVEIQPASSLLRAELPRYQKNDPATGKIRWIGKLKLFEVVLCGNPNVLQARQIRSITAATNPRMPVGLLNREAITVERASALASENVRRRQ